MTSMLRTATVTLIAGLVLCGTATAGDWKPAEPTFERDSPPGIAVVVDLYLLRPAGLLRLVAGAAAFVPIALITAPNGKESVRSALEIFVTEPLEYVFVRKPGEF
jgi:hypothetical protein